MRLLRRFIGMQIKEQKKRRAGVILVVYWRDHSCRCSKRSPVPSSYPTILLHSPRNNGEMHNQCRDYMSFSRISSSADARSASSSNGEEQRLSSTTAISSTLVLLRRGNIEEEAKHLTSSSSWVGLWLLSLQSQELLRFAGVVYCAVWDNWRAYHECLGDSSEIVNG